MICINDTDRENVLLKQYLRLNFFIYLNKRSVNPEVFRKKVVFEISQKSQENTCARVSFYITLQA